VVIFLIFAEMALLIAAIAASSVARPVAYRD
jgi:hypothetical protein